MAENDRRSRLFGRRLGRPLRPGLSRLVETRLPALSLAPAAASGQLDPRRCFARDHREVWLEIGFGGGEHLAAQADTRHDIAFIGAEVFLNGVATLLREIEQRGLDNIRIWQDDARQLLPALPEAALGRCFLLFPDPWPKTRHAKRRFIQRESLDQLARVLRDDAELRVATDDPVYLRWVLRHLLDHPDFRWTARRPGDWRWRPADWPATRYEEKAREAGRQPAFLRFRRLPRPGVVDAP